MLLSPSLQLLAGVQSDVVLLARSTEGLEETKSQITSTAPRTNVHLVQADLADLESLKSVFSQVTKSAAANQHQQYVLIHNAGTLGDLTKPMIEQTDPKAIQNHFAVNYTSVFILSGYFLSHFTSGHRMVINISSLLAVKYLPSFSLYSSAHAARRAVIGVLTVENPDVRVLNYSPGPCETDMQTGIREQSFSESVREQFKSLAADKNLLTCRESISKMMKVLREDKFENGGVVDYFD